MLKSVAIRMKPFEVAIPKKKRTSSFTLIELLVVIAIIAILASMLLPALGRARALAQGSKCLSNQRQCMFGLISYSMESDDFYPMADDKLGNAHPEFKSVANTDYGWWSSYLRYTGHLPRYSSGSWLTACKVLVNSRWPASPGDYWYTYGIIEAYIKATKKYVSLKSDYFKIPANWAFLSEVYCSGPYAPTMRGGFEFFPWGSTTWSGIDSTPAIILAHGNKANVVFADGHANSLPFMELYWIHRKISGTYTHYYPSIIATTTNYVVIPGK